MLVSTATALWISSSLSLQTPWLRLPRSFMASRQGSSSHTGKGFHTDYTHERKIPWDFANMQCLTRSAFIADRRVREAPFHDYAPLD